MDSHIAKETQRIAQDLKRVQREVWQDPLTGVFNRRFLEEELPKIYDAQREDGENLSLVMIDMDGFKQLNDTFGHAAGDEVLRFLGALLRQCVRSEDFSARFGGDEFVLILPGVSVEDALQTTNRIMALFSQRAKMMFNMDQPPSVSAGIASIHNNRPSDLAELLSFADEALLRAKRAGKRLARISASQGGTETSLPRLSVPVGGVAQGEAVYV